MFCNIVRQLHVGVLSPIGHVEVFATPWTAAHQIPLSMGFSRQEYWSGLSSPSPGDLPKPRIKPSFPTSSASQADSLPTKPPIVHRLQFNLKKNKDSRFWLTHGINIKH